MHMVGAYARILGYLALGLALGAAIWALGGASTALSSRLWLGVALVAGIVLGRALHGRLKRAQPLIGAVLRLLGYLALGLTLGAAVWALRGADEPIAPKLAFGLMIVAATVIGMALRSRPLARRLRHTTAP